MDFAMPKHVAPPLLCRYEPGMKYGGHADSALIQVGGTRIRSDLSCTVFVSDPSTYDGGELSIEVGNLAIPIKGAAGEAIVYPSTTLHEVVPVRSGQRLVSITFIESYIADEHKRTQVYELNEIAALEGLSMKWENRVRLDVVRQNLIRMWSTTEHRLSASAVSTTAAAALSERATRASHSRPLRISSRLSLLDACRASERIAGE
jgi:PKHD-type hydroxylase